MPAMSIRLTDELRARLQARAAEGGFVSIEAYVEAMLLADAAGPVIDDAQLESLLLERQDGPFVDADAGDFQQIRKKLKERLRRNADDTAGGAHSP